MNLNLPQPFEKQVKEFVIAHNLNLEEFAVSAFQEKMQIKDMPFQDDNIATYHIKEFTTHVKPVSKIEQLLQSTSSIWQQGDGLEFQQKLRN